MSDDPKGDMMKETGPLGHETSVPREVIQAATPTQAAILYQNDDQLRALSKLEGMVEQGFKGAHGRMDRMDSVFNERFKPLEDFNDKVTLLPRAIYWLMSIVGIDGLIRLLHWL